MNCWHTAVIDGQHFCFTGSASTPGATEENRAAHGGITYRQTCTECKAVRTVNQNGRHYEYGAWIPSPTLRNYCR